MHEVKDKARLLYGLLNVLRDEIDTLRHNASENDISSAIVSIAYAKTTISLMKTIINEIEHLMCAEE